MPDNRRKTGPRVTVLRIQADQGVLPQGTRSRRKAERRAAR